MQLYLNRFTAGASAASVTSLVVRVAVGAILIWGAATKLLTGNRMGEIADAWGAAGLPQPQLLVTASISLQLLLAVLLLVGFATRPAALMSALNFGFAAAATGIFTSGLNWWPFALLIVLLLHLGALGAGIVSVDGLRSRRLRLARSSNGKSVEDLLDSMGIKPTDSGNYPG